MVFKSNLEKEKEMKVEICVKAPHECTITSGHDNRRQTVTIGAGETKVHALDVASRIYVKACGHATLLGFAECHGD